MTDSTASYVVTLREAAADAFPLFTVWRERSRPVPGDGTITIQQGRLRDYPAHWRRAVGPGYFELMIDGDLGGRVEIAAREIAGVELACVRAYESTDWLDTALRAFDDGSNGRFLRAVYRQRHNGEHPHMTTCDAEASGRLFAMLYRARADGK